MQQELATPTEDSGARPRHLSLKLAIVEAGVRQFAIAERLGISEGQLSRMLAGRKPIDDAQAEAIREAIGALSA